MAPPPLLYFILCSLPVGVQKSVTHVWASFMFEELFVTDLLLRRVVLIAMKLMNFYCNVYFVEESKVQDVCVWEGRNVYCGP
jgi:hypothetical protein